MICCLNYELQRKTGYKGKNNGIVPCQKVVTVQSWQRYPRVDMKPAMSGEGTCTFLDGKERQGSMMHVFGLGAGRSMTSIILVIFS